MLLKVEGYDVGQDPEKGSVHDTREVAVLHTGNHRGLHSLKLDLVNVAIGVMQLIQESRVKKSHVATDQTQLPLNHPRFVNEDTRMYGVCDDLLIP